MAGAGRLAGCRAQYQGRPAAMHYGYSTNSVLPCMAALTDNPRYSNK